MSEIQGIIESAWDNRELLGEGSTQNAILEVIRMLNFGEVRVANQIAPGQWVVNEWVKKAITLYFPIQPMETIKVGPFEFHDKIPLKTGFARLATVHHGLCPMAMRTLAHRGTHGATDNLWR